MAKLVVWISAQDGDSACYNIVGKTRKEVLSKIAKVKADWAEVGMANECPNYEIPVKKVFFYKNAFDLFDMATSEAGGRGC